MNIINDGFDYLKNGISWTTGINNLGNIKEVASGDYLLHGDDTLANRISHIATEAGIFACKWGVALGTISKFLPGRPDWACIPYGKLKSNETVFACQAKGTETVLKCKPIIQDFIDPVTQALNPNPKSFLCQDSQNRFTNHFSLENGFVNSLRAKTESLTDLFSSFIPSLSGSYVDTAGSSFGWLAASVGAVYCVNKLGEIMKNRSINTIDWNNVDSIRAGVEALGLGFSEIAGVALPLYYGYQAYDMPGVALFGLGTTAVMTTAKAGGLKTSDITRVAIPLLIAYEQQGLMGLGTTAALFAGAIATYLQNKNTFLLNSVSTIPVALALIANANRMTPFKLSMA